MKFQHHFHLLKAAPHFRIYHADQTTIRLDFFEHILRVAVLRDDVPLFPTYTVRPRTNGDPAVGYGPCGFPPEGRPRLSTEGFSLLAPDVLESDDRITFTIDDVTFSIDLFNFRMHAANGNGLLFCDRDYLSYNFDHEFGDGSMHFISREADERIFGLGDKTGPVNKNGQSYKISASDAMGFDARSSDPLYKQLPFYICDNSNGSYGIYYDTYSNGEMNFGREINNYYTPFKSFCCDEEHLVYYVILGNVGEIVTRFSMMCGPLHFPPRWSFAYAGSTMAYTDAPDADRQLRGFLSSCDEHGIRPCGFYLSSGYTQIGKKRYVFHWNTDKIPSPEDLSAHFLAHGTEFFPNVKPAFLVNHPMYGEIAEKGWFLHYADGTPAIFPFWDDYGSYLDFTNPQAFSFWTDCVKKQLVDKGYRHIWNDNNEYDIRDKEVYADGFGHPVRAYLIRPLFSFLMTMASLAAQDASERTVSVSRCGIGGLSRIASTWTGDNNTDFADFRYNHYMAMTMSLSGFFNFGQDIGGFAGACPNEELFIRWIQYGIFTPRFVLHSWNLGGAPTMPWTYPDKLPAVKRLFALREALIPYLYNEMYKSCQTHFPVIFPVFLKQPDYDTESDAFFFGEHILAAPVFTEGADSVTVALPENPDGWYQGRDARHLPVSTVTVPCTTDDLPVFFIRAASVIPWADEGAPLRTADLSAICFTVYPPASGSFSYTYLQDDGTSWLDDNNHTILTFDVRCDERQVVVRATPNTRCRIELNDYLSRNLVVE